VEGIVRALNVFGIVAVVVLAFYVGWVLVTGDEDDKVPLAVPVARTPASR
jgi:hypothetical protein